MSKKRHFSHSAQEQIGQHAINHIGPIADRLETIVSGLVDESSISYRPDNGADTMALAFVSKQREHLRSVRILIGAEAHRDALLITRTMVEGSGRLRWAFKDTPERTELWLWFGAIRDWRQIQENAANGRTVDPDELDQLKQYVDAHGHKYYRPDVRKAITKAQERGQKYDLPPDPWGYSWTDISVKVMFDELDDTDKYDGLYRRSSEWVHWDPRSIFQALDMAPSGAKGFIEQDWLAGGLAFPLACLSLLECLQVLDGHFSLGMNTLLEDLRSEMVAILNQAISAAEGFSEASGPEHLLGFDWCQSDSKDWLTNDTMSKSFEKE